MSESKIVIPDNVQFTDVVVEYQSKMKSLINSTTCQINHYKNLISEEEKQLKKYQTLLFECEVMLLKANLNQ